MNVPPWTVAAIPRARLSTQQLVLGAGRMRCMGIAVQATPGTRSTGQIIFSTQPGNGQVAVVWQWAELRHRCVCIDDPMMVLSNVVLVDDAGKEIHDASSRITHLNSLIYLLPWQDCVLARLHERTEEPVAA